MGDSSVFAYIGKEMAEGKIPYRDLFDHKGPVLYLIQYLGYRITPGRFTGIWILEIVNMLVTLLVLRPVCSEASERRTVGCLALFMTFVFCGHAVYEGGNFTEEYALPWISAAAAVFFPFFRTGKYRKRDIVLLGACFSAVFLLRANMISIWLVFIPAVFIILIRQKRCSEILKCLGLFLLGCMLAFGPILLFFAVNNALEDFWNCYLVFNVVYSDEVSLGLTGMLKLTASFLLKLWPGMLAAAFSVIKRKKDPIRWLNLLYLVVSLLMAEMSGRDYPHYLISVLPALVIPFCDVFDFFIERIGAKEIDRMLQPTILGCCILLTIGTVAWQTVHRVKNRPEEPVERWLKENTDKNSDVLVLGNSVWVYLVSDRHTGNRYFYQTPPVAVSEVLYEDFLAELEMKPSDVVVNMSAGKWSTEVSEKLKKQGYDTVQLENCDVYVKKQAA